MFEVRVSELVKPTTPALYGEIHATQSFLVDAILSSLFALACAS